MKDIAKKIILGVIILEIIIIIISAIIIINNKFNKAETNNEENTENVDSENFIIAEVQEEKEEITDEQPKDNTNESIEPKVEKDNSCIETKDIKKEIPKQQKKVQSTEKEIIQNQSNQNKSSITNIEENKSSKESNDSNNSKNSNIPNNSSKNDNNSTQIKEDTTKVESFRYNKEMTEKLINTIKTNESDYMKNYGYEVVIDENIVNSTNQFTFTESRVKNKVIYKFGTIKVYARDYYVGNEYKWTECFII